jgi:hypothetical protein
MLVRVQLISSCTMARQPFKPGGRLVFPLVRWPHGSKFGSGPARWGVMLPIQRLEAGYSAEVLSPAGFFPCLNALDAMRGSIGVRRRKSGRGQGNETISAARLLRPGRFIESIGRHHTSPMQDAKCSRVSIVSAFVLMQAAARELSRGHEFTRPNCATVTHRFSFFDVTMRCGLVGAML